MLLKLGWTPGKGLGADEQGGTALVDARIRAARRGLGTT